MVAKTNVSSRQGQKKGWQAAPLFQRGGDGRTSHGAGWFATLGQHITINKTQSPRFSDSAH